MARITMEASKAVLLLMVILGSLMIPAYSRNVVRFCKCEKRACKKGAISEGVCYCCPGGSCYSTVLDCSTACRCNKLSHALHFE
ncbi:hypothetical protein Zm00014a_017381 [Zea mays]|uniref:Uncharacterized protein n=2 Tax=Zea mays TaxID=4577 RepID=A0A804N4R2_MAIZE|nr:uncharacterized protein LOC103650254 precursor [Zea mays]PWZ33086.1 hypothetical protein Zm00014a_017381 [Zea mays]|eukprot:NP_001315491.1 uncharacterized protein LOC103650254 precursor [Zea mays]